MEGISLGKLSFNFDIFYYTRKSYKLVDITFPKLKTRIFVKQTATKRINASSIKTASSLDENEAYYYFFE